MEKISSYDCDWNGLNMITSKKQCKKAAEVLGLEKWHDDNVRGEKTIPRGCIYHSHSKWLGWVSPVDNPDANEECNNHYECLCVRYGNPQNSI